MVVPVHPDMTYHNWRKGQQKWGNPPALCREQESENDEVIEQDNSITRT